MEKVDSRQVVWDDDGLAFHAGSGLPVTGEVVWPDLVMTEGHYVDGVRQGAGNRYYSPAGRALARREAEAQVRIILRREQGRLVERRGVNPDGSLAWVERWDGDGSPLPGSAPPLREALASPDPGTALAARRAVLDRGEELRRRILELEAAAERHRVRRAYLQELERPTAAQRARVHWHERAEGDLELPLARATEELRTLEDWYRGWVPRVPVARCPHSGAVAAFPIDTAGLDGWAWRYRLPVRPYHWNELPATWLAMAGAMRLNGPVAVPFEARPGPEVPYVIPRILDHRADVRAVIAEVPVGQHTGWAITYFAREPIPAKLVSTWGEATYHWRGRDGAWHWEDGGWTPEHFDFRVGDNDYDLGPWLRDGKLLWIAPGDAELTLRSGEDGCPYVGLSGSRHMTEIVNGTVWRAGQ